MPGEQHHQWQNGSPGFRGIQLGGQVKIANWPPLIFLRLPRDFYIQENVLQNQEHTAHRSKVTH